MCVCRIFGHSQVLRLSARSVWPVCERVQLSWTGSWSETKKEKNRDKQTKTNKQTWNEEKRKKERKRANNTSRDLFSLWRWALSTLKVEDKLSKENTFGNMSPLSFIPSSHTYTYTHTHTHTHTHVCFGVFVRTCFNQGFLAHHTHTKNCTFNHSPSLCVHKTPYKWKVMRRKAFPHLLSSSPFLIPFPHPVHEQSMNNALLTPTLFNLVLWDTWEMSFK